MRKIYTLQNYKKRFSKINGEQGMATIEAIPILIIFVWMVSFAMGFFGVIHTAILHSIAARTYAFETFRNRTNLTYFREDSESKQQYADRQMRFHGIQPERNITSSYEDITATSREIAIGREVKTEKANFIDHNVKVFSLEERNRDLSFNPVWIKVAYGICLSAGCGDE